MHVSSGASFMIFDFTYKIVKLLYLVFHGNFPHVIMIYGLGILLAVYSISLF